MELRAEIVIRAPAGAAWAVVGERFGQIGKWAAHMRTLLRVYESGSVRVPLLDALAVEANHGPIITRRFKT